MFFPQPLTSSSVTARASSALLAASSRGKDPPWTAVLNREPPTPLVEPDPTEEAKLCRRNRLLVLAALLTGTSLNSICNCVAIRTW